jgi:hypothetical protein
MSSTDRWGNITLTGISGATNIDDRSGDITDKDSNQDTI